jgi:hypothetical protein
MFLPDELIQRARAHPIGEGPGPVNRVVASGDGLKKTHKI